MLKAKQRSAAGALLGLALNQAQIHQSNELKSSTSRDSASEGARLWVHQSSDLLRPVFRALEIDDKEWPGLEEIARSSSANHHIEAFLKVVSEEGGGTSAKAKEKELTLTKAIDDVASSMKTPPADSKGKKEKRREYEQECREKFSTHQESESDSEVANKNLEIHLEMNSKLASIEQAPIESASKVDEKTKVVEQPKVDEKPFEAANKMLGYQRKVAVLYELLSACLADKPDEDDKQKSTRRRKGYDARHRLALRLLATWLNLEWIKMEAIETTVALSAMALLKEEESKEQKAQSSEEDTWAKWKRGGIVGAAAITGGTLMAISGGLAAPAIAAGFGALAPALGVVPVLGGGFAAVATAAGSVAGSAAVAASFGAAGAGLTGTKMAKRTGGIDEFEFKAIGENHNKGHLAVEILISGFVFKEEDFIRPWEAHDDNLESYALQWESKHLIAVSNALQDWIRSKLKTELMKQGAMLTVFSTLVTAVAWPTALLTVTNLIDSKWAMAIDRSDKAGKVLAEVLMKGLQGHRPVTLVGFSLGARVIFKCLQELAENELNASLVERVILLGAPVPIQDENWEAIRRVVAGRFVNAYSTSDWMLGLAFRASLLTQGLAGIQPIDVPGIQNVNVTELIEGHSSYLWASQYILDQLDLDNYNPVFTPTPVKS